VNRVCKCVNGKLGKPDKSGCVSQTPICGAGKTLSANRKSCVTAQIGSNCGGIFQPKACVNIGFSQCSAGKCRCKNTFVQSGNSCICPNGKTLKGGQCAQAKIGDSCSGPTNIKACNGPVGSTCQGGTCKCGSGSAKAANGLSCIPICGAGKTLSGNKKNCVAAQIGSNCGGIFQPQACVNIGNAQCGAGKCRCKNTFVQSGNSCICPVGKTLKGGQCEQAKIDDSCSGPTSLRACNSLQGSSCQGVTCKCEAGSAKAANGLSCTPICGAGKTLSGNKKNCVPAQIGSNCGGIFQPQACVNIGFAQCIGGKCKCKNTFANSEGRCICPAGKTLKGGLCVQAKVNDFCGERAERACANLMNTECKSDRCKCKSGSSLVGNSCVTQGGYY